MHELIIMLAQEGTEPARSLEVANVWDFIVKGGVMMIPIGICSFVALTVIIERFYSLRRPTILPPNFLSGLRQALGSRAGDREAALGYCREHESPLASVFAAAIRRLDRPAEAVERAVAEAGEREALRLRKHLRVLAVIAAVAPLLGLLGTIFGMIQAFQTVAVSGEALGKTEMLAGGIYEAMITTAAGLLVAIPTLIFHHWIAAKVDGLVMEMDRLTLEFIDEFAHHGQGAPGWAGAPEQAAGQEESEVRPPVKLARAGMHLT